MNNFGIDTRARMLLVMQRSAALNREAEIYRLTRSDEPVSHIASRVFRSIGARLDRPFARVQGAVSAAEEPCDDNCPDGAPC